MPNIDQVMPIVNALIPIITSFVKRQMDERGTFPTDAEVLANLNKDADSVEVISNAWLAAHPAVNFSDSSSSANVNQK